jgi:hypothetical protein
MKAGMARLTKIRIMADLTSKVLYTSKDEDEVMEFILTKERRR